MSHRAQICRQTAEKLRSFGVTSSKPSIMIGFDGFVDSIISVVEKRDDVDHFQPVETITRFGEKILDAAGQSSNYELVVTREKLGGNGPIMANALATFGFPIRYIGELGHPHIHPVFSEFAAVADCISIANPGLTDALEFDDGKLMLGKHQSLKNVNWQTLCDIVGVDEFRQLISQSQLLGMVNWTMLLDVEEIWRRLAEDILPSLPQINGRRRQVFVDLADPEKRTSDDLLAALQLLSKFQDCADLVLGLNLKESEAVAETLGVPAPVDFEADLEAVATGIRQSLGVHGVVIHPRSFAAVCWLEERQEVTARFSGPRIDDPKILTGGGDHFNAGFCLGWLAGLPAEEALCAGTSTSGYYVANAISPKLDVLTEFISSNPAPAL